MLDYLSLDSTEIQDGLVKFNTTLLFIVKAQYYFLENSHGSFTDVFSKCQPTKVYGKVNFENLRFNKIFSYRY